jgi:nitroreductase
MELYEAIQNRRTVHQYAPATIDPDVLKKGLSMALLAPNHKLTFPWSFVVMGPETRASLKELAKDMKRSKQVEPFTEEQEQKLDEMMTQKFLNPAAIVAFCCERTTNDFQQREDYAAVACGIQNFCLAMTAEGYNSKWGTGGLTRESSVYELLQVDPQKHEIVGFLFVGKPIIPPRQTKRPELASCLRELP